MEVYRQSNLERSRNRQGGALLEAEQDFYDYLSRVFFRTPGAVYALWEGEGSYASALRLEPYKDGLILSALETAPHLRRRGYGKLLVDAVLSQFPREKIYSHIAKDNVASRNLHEALGFRKISDHALYLDGSSDHRCDTYLWKNTANGS